MKAADLERPETLECDVAIVGGGAGGSAAVKVLAEKGRKVVLLEEGGHHLPGSFRNNTFHALRHLYANHGKRVTEGVAPFAIMSGKGLGGGTLVNSGISFRPPEKALQRWTSKAGLKDTTLERLGPYMDEIEKLLSIERAPYEKMGRNNTIYAEGLKKLGWRGGVIPRNTINCQPCARCFFGCPTGAKQSTDKNFLALGEIAGAEIWYHSRVTKIQKEGRRVTGLQVAAIDPSLARPIHQFEVKAKHYILSAGAIGTARILLSQGLANSSGQVGMNFHCHPSVGVLGHFDEMIEGYKSIMQSYYSDEFFESDEILLETFWAPGEAIAHLLPGIGLPHLERAARFKYLAGSGAMIRDEGSGQVFVDRDGHARVKYQLTIQDERRLARALYRACEPLLAAGAKEVFVNLPRRDVFRSIDEVKEFEKRRPNLGSAVVLEGNHAQGTCRMDANPRRGVTNEFGRTHDLDNLWIMDSSLFPDALGVNPQITIMALAMRNAEYLHGNFS